VGHGRSGAGRAARLARKEGESYFTAFGSNRWCRATPPPAHPPQFREAEWHGLRWVFDGQEPLFLHRNDNLLDNMKLSPATGGPLHLQLHHRLERSARRRS